MSKKQVSGTHTAVKRALDETRSSAKIVAAIVRTALDEAEGYVGGENRARVLLADLEGWIAGGPVPASAKRYVALLRATDSVEVGYTRRGADAAQTALDDEYFLATHNGSVSAFADTLTSLLEWAEGSQRRGLDIVLSALVREIAECQPSNDNATECGLKRLLSA